MNFGKLPVRHLHGFHDEFLAPLQDLDCRPPIGLGFNSGDSFPQKLELPQPHNCECLTLQASSKRYLHANERSGRCPEQDGQVCPFNSAAGGKSGLVRGLTGDSGESLFDGRGQRCYRLFVIAVAGLVAIGLWLFNEKTLVGAKLRAAVDDYEMAGGVGVNVPLVSGFMFALGACLAGFGGVMGGPIFGAYPGLDFELLSLGFVVVIVGGRGSLMGSAVGSILVGLVDNFGKALFPELSYFTLFAPMAIIVAVKPTGLFGRA